MATTQVVPSSQVSTSPASEPSRREFLYYLWGASMALALGGAGAGLLWYMLPRADPKEVYILDANDLPSGGSTVLVRPAQLNQRNVRLIISHTDDNSLMALDRLCTHEHCLVKWVPLNHRYECPCHGAKFTIDGTYIEGPAPRHLDRYPITITFTDGITTTSNESGDPIALNGREIASVTVDTRRLIEGAQRR